MVMAETSTFSFFRGRNVHGRNVQAKTSLAEMSVAEMSEHRLFYTLHQEIKQDIQTLRLQLRINHKFSKDIL